MNVLQKYLDFIRSIDLCDKLQFLKVCYSLMCVKMPLNFYQPASCVFAVHKPSGPYIEPITEERANRCLARIDLLCKIREQILHNPQLDERTCLCQPSGDMPEWWVCGVHDRDLLVGAARYL